MTADVLWAGTDDGNVQVTRDGGKNLEKCCAESAWRVRAGTYVSRVRGFEVRGWFSLRHV